MVIPDRVQFGHSAEACFDRDNPDWVWMNRNGDDKRYRFDFRSSFHPWLTLDVQSTRHSDSEIRLYDKKIVLDNSYHLGEPPARLFMFYRIDQPVGWISWYSVIYSIIKQEWDRSDAEGFYRIPDSDLTGGFPPA